MTDKPTISSLPVLISSTEDRLPAYVSTRRKTLYFSPPEVQQILTRVLQTDASFERSVTLEMLFSFVSLTEQSLFRLVSERVAVSEKFSSFYRQLARYRNDGLIALVGNMVSRHAIRAGVPGVTGHTLRAYRLGPVGEAYVKEKKWSNGPLATVSDEGNLAHDLICAEAMLRIRDVWPTLSNPSLADVYGPRRVSIWDYPNSVSLIEPDGLLLKRDMQGEFQRAYLIEYHNVDWAENVSEKVAKYEAIGDPENKWRWRAVWGTDAMPAVLALYRHPHIVEYYQREIDALSRPRCEYFVCDLNAIWQGKLRVTPITKKPKGQPVDKPGEQK